MIFKKLLPEKFKNNVKTLLGTRKKFLCPFCLFTSNDFKVIGFDFPVLSEKKVIGSGRRAGGCLNCGSSDRERLVYIFIKNELRILKKGRNQKILHIAPERNLSKVFLQRGFSNYFPADLSPEKYEYLEKIEKMDILDIPYPNDYFDLIICNHVLEHIEDDIAAMKQIWHVLKTGGFAILQVPISLNSAKTFEDFSISDPRLRELYFGQEDHVRIYGQDYVKRLQISGFTVKRVNISQKYPKFGLNPDEDIFVCSKF